MRNRLVGQHPSERRPAGVEYGLRHPRLGQLGRAGVADGNEIVGEDEARGQFVQEVSARVLDLGVDGGGEPLLVGALGRGESVREPLEESGPLHLLAVAQGRQRLEAEVDADGSSNEALRRSREFSDDIHVPAATRILRE